MAENTEIADLFNICVLEEVVEGYCCGDVVVEIVQENEDPVGAENVGDYQKVLPRRSVEFWEGRALVVVPDFVPQGVKSSNH